MSRAVTRAQLADAASCLARARIQYARGDAGRCRTQIDAGLRLVEGSGTSVEAELLVEAARLTSWNADPALTLEAALRAHRAAVLSGASIDNAALVVGMAHYMAGSEECFRWWKRARRASRGQPSASDVYFEAAYFAAGGFFAFGQGNRSVRFAEALTRVAAAGRKPRYEVLAAWLAARGRMLAHGELERAAAELAVLLERPGLGLNRPHMVADLAFCLADIGRPDEARRIVRKSAKEADTGFTRSSASAYMAEIEWAAGRPGRAIALAEEALPDLMPPMSSLARLTRSWSLFELGLAAADGFEEDGSSHFGRCVEQVQCAFSRLAEGGIEDACSHLLHAADGWRAFVVREELKARWGAAELKLRLGLPDEARELLWEVERRASAHRMESILIRTRKSLHRLERPSRARPGRAATVSAREREVLSFVAAGLSSRRIAELTGLGTATVETHVRRAMTKLGATTRAHAALLAGIAPTLPAAVEGLEPELRALLALLAGGGTISAASRVLGISRRSATRRLEEARRVVGAATTAEVVAAYGLVAQIGDSEPFPPP